MSPSADSRWHHRRGRPVIGMLFGFQMFGTGLTYNFIDSLARGIRAGAQDRNSQLLMACGMSLLNPENLRPAWPTMASDVDFVPVGPWNTDGLVVVHPLCSTQRMQYIRDLKDSGFPIVFVGTAEGGPAIDLDNKGGIGLALQHLVEHGHRQIAFIGGVPEDSDGDGGERLRAFQHFAQELKLDTDPRLTAYGYHHVVGGREAMRNIMATGARFTAVLASNDESALGAIQTLTEAGLRVPQDIAVIGFDNRPSGAYELPPLTSVHHPVFERGYRAVELLLDNLENGRANDSIVNVPTRLVVRRSCGCTLENILARADKVTAAASDVAASAPALRTRLTKSAMNAVLAETLHLNPAEVYELSSQLADALVTSVEHHRAVDFLSTMQGVLARVEQAGYDTDAWSFAIDALEKEASVLTSISKDDSTPLLLQTLLQHARVAIAASKRRQHWRERHFAAEVQGFLTVRLLAARDDTQILTTLAEHLPKIGIHRAAIVLFEPEENDPVAWSVMRIIGTPTAEPVRFRTWEFPPPEFSDIEKSPVPLALVPIVAQKDVFGYMVLEADNLDPCASIAHAVTTALKSARMYRDVVETSHLYRDALEGRRAAEEASGFKSRLLSEVSHELRTPLSLILSASELLEKKKRNISDDDARNLVNIRASAQHLDGLIRDVQDLTRNELGQLRLSCEPVDLVAALEPVAVVGEQLARAKGVKWSAQIPTDLPSVWADRARLRQIALNLVTNAMKFTAKGQVTLRVESTRNSILIVVEDTGIGVPPEEREIIFDEHRQSSRTVDQYDGLGLGLAICKRLVTMHGGHIGVRADEKVGSTFYFTLPVVKMGLEAIERALDRERTTLLVDDSFIADEGLFARLVTSGFPIQRVRADDFGNWIDTLTNDLPAAVLISIRLAQARGAELVKRLREHPAMRDVPLLFCSLTWEQEPVTAPKLDYLAKPIGSMELARALQRQGVTGDDNQIRTLLVVEDDPGLLETHVKILQSLPEPYRVLKASNGKDALAIIQDQLPDLVLLDLNMPQMSGFEVLEAMQQHVTTHNIPVIVLTGQALTDQDMARLNHGVASVLAKGVFTVEETLSHVRDTIGSNPLMSGEAQRLVRKAMAYIHEHFSEPLTRKEIAGHLQISEDHLTRCFRQTVRIPPVTYVTRYRINRAKTLLETGEMSVAAVAAAVGFSNEFHFSQVFRRETGSAPSAYRRARSQRR